MREGHVTALNRAGLEEATCECYGVIRRQLQNWEGRIPVSPVAYRLPTCAVLLLGQRGVGRLVDGECTGSRKLGGAL
jgi:hypothetical protein